MMRSLHYLTGAAGTILMLVTVSGPVLAQDEISAEESIKSEIVARYRSFEGESEDQTWEKWQDYFLESPNIANMHGTRLEIGWETYQQGSVEYFQQPVERRAAIRFEELRVYVIDAHTAWATGVFVNIIGEREIRPTFYDMLIKTAEGWRVFFSYVAPPK
jgi:hypothetical protein